MTNWSEKSALRWDCAEKGCHNVFGRPKLLALYDSLPGKISFGDVDAAVEINGNFLILEWKGVGAPFHLAQSIFHRNLTALSKKIISVVVCGDAASMNVVSVQVIRCGIIGPSEQCDLDGLKKRIRRWAFAASKLRRVA